jgi:predicted CoA-substrate-specific enzyme activase
MEKVTLLRERTVSFSYENKKLPVEVYLGLDIGSVSTKLAIIDENQALVKEIYIKTDSRPIEVVTKMLKEVSKELGTKIRVHGVGTTGSGRELIGQLVGADTINDEITAHKTGAMYISQYFLNKSVTTIFDIGGQDSKYISIKNGIVVDFAMNEACAAGTGSFLEEQADKLDIKIKDEFAKLAFQSQNPIDLGERCTVFMEKVLIPYLQQGAKKEDLIAGLAYSIVQNYLNRVVRGRTIGNVVFFQGGTAYNDAVAAAFSTILNREIIVPPYNGVLGALGAAILAREKMKPGTHPTRFRGFDLEKIHYELHHFTCKGCANLCDIQEFKVDGDRSYWGDKCADRYRKARKTEKIPTIPDLVKFRETLFAPFLENSGSGPKIGIPRSMYFHDRFPFWGTYLKETGFQLIISDQTNKTIINQGIAASIAEPCYPIIIAHGHIQNLIEKQVDFIFQPNVINAEAQLPRVESFLCPWGQTQPFIFKQTPAFKQYWHRFISPTIRFREEKAQIQQMLYATFKSFGIKRKQSDLAFEKAFSAQNAFNNELVQTGSKAIEVLLEKNESAIILVGRPYNLYDRTVNLNIPDKLRNYYGVNVIPIDFLPLDGIDISDVNDGMFWNFGFKILQTGKLVEQHQNFHIIYFTNFKCGPDSYIKHFLPDATSRPFLVLQFDGHNNDAGMLTRCEAYLDSKGLLR